MLAVLLVLGTLTDLVRARHPPLAALPDAAPVPVTAPPDSSRAGTPAASRTPLDLNAASAAELDALPGIGPVLAARIVEHRRRQGPFRSVEELRSVPGIGPKLLARLRPALREPPG